VRKIASYTPVFNLDRYNQNPILNTKHTLLGSNSTIPAATNDKTTSASEANIVKKEKSEETKPKPSKLVKKVGSFV